MTILILIGCSGGGMPTAPGSPGDEQIALAGDLSHPVDAKIVGEDGPRMLWGLYNIIVTPDYELQVEPLRSAEKHHNLTQFLLPPLCKYCLKLQKTGLDVSAAWISFNVSLANPTKLIGYDVRGIIIGDSDYYLMNPDALTTYTGPIEYEPPNGFKAYATDEPLCGFPADGNPSNPTYFTREFKIHIPPPYQQPKLLEIKYAVDVSWPHNCQDPWKIGDLVLDDVFYESTPDMGFTLDVNDHQDDVGQVTLEAPSGWMGPTPVLTKVDADTWTGTFNNCANNPPGQYSFYVTAKSYDSSTPPQPLYLYKYVTLTVSEFECAADAKTQPAGAEKIALKGQVWDSVCELNVRDYYLIDFNDPSMQQPGVLSGSVVLRSCVPGMRLELVYYEPTTDTYFDGLYDLTESDGLARIPIHIPNSLLVGDIDEVCYLRVKLPGSAVTSVPYSLTTDLTYETVNCGDPISISTIGAPDIPFTQGMIQGVLCDPAQMDWYRLDTLGQDAQAGSVKGTLSVEIEFPDPVPPAAVTAVSLRDEDGTLLANFYVPLPPTPANINLGDIDLPSRFATYLCISSPTSSATIRAYKIKWSAQIEQNCTSDLIELTNPSAPEISPTKTGWNSTSSPGSCARMWLCSPNDLVDAYPFTIPAGWPDTGEVLGGNIRVQSDPGSFGDVKLSLGLQLTLGNKFSWYKPITLTGPDITFDVTDYWEAPVNISSFPLKYWLKVENTGSDWAVAQVEMDLKSQAGCEDEGDTDQDPAGLVVVGGTITSYVAPDTDPADYWDLDWSGVTRLKGYVGAVSMNNIRLSLYDGASMLASSEGTTPSVDVNQFDFGPGCFGPILKIEPLGGTPGQCIQYFASGVSLSETTQCEVDPDNNDSYAEIQDKPWLWLSAIDTTDSICGVVCRDGADADWDVIGIADQPYPEQGVLYGFISLDSSSDDGHQIRLISMDGAMDLESDNVTAPFYTASIELDQYNLPSIPPKGWIYYVVVGPDPLGTDSFSPYVCFSSMGINTECVDDGHDLQSEAWLVGLDEARLGLICGLGEPEQIDAGLPDLADWFKLNYVQSDTEFLEGTITLTCEREGVKLRLMSEGELAATGTALYEAAIETGNDTATIAVPADTLPSVPAVGTRYYVVVHDTGDQLAPVSYGVRFNLVSQ
jgi:hypothetical protein